MSSQDQPVAAEEDLPHAAWCREKHDSALCERRMSWPTQPVQVFLVLNRRKADMYIAIRRNGLPSVFLDDTEAQALATMLAFVAPSEPTRALAVALQEAAAVIFRILGYPDTGPRERAINPWKPER